MRSRYAVTMLAAALVGIATPCGAVQFPTPTRSDPRVRTLPYDPQNVVVINGVMRSVSEVTFAPTEVITRVALGDSIAWEVVPADNILFLKPRAQNPPTNMVVVTKRADGSLRTYNFSLSIRGGEDNDMGPHRSDVAFSIVFRYPADEAEARARQAELEGTAAQTAAARDRLATSAAEGPINFAYTASGSTELEPASAWDNGKVTTLVFPQNQAIPAIFSVLPDKSESRIDYTVDPLGQVVVHGVFRELRLRRGAVTTSIYNRAYSAIGDDPGTGTISPNVARRVTPEAIGVVPSQGPISLTPPPAPVPQGPPVLTIPLTGLTGGAQGAAPSPGAQQAGPVPPALPGSPEAPQAPQAR